MCVFVRKSLAGRSENWTVAMFRSGQCVPNVVTFEARKQAHESGSVFFWGCFPPFFLLFFSSHRLSINYRCTWRQKRCFFIHHTNFFLYFSYETTTKKRQKMKVVPNAWPGARSTHTCASLVFFFFRVSPGFNTLDGPPLEIQWWWIFSDS